ncbi:PadR family transcriptional regulator [Pseudoalteromonas ulvae]|uniref:PadR family transcriptional regulator n=1 Tax=Pseudoalteromonas ulvae TaxID=107327 RepID=A0A244CL92_PSEDV|nr:helix-turn-helix transcriptional regulator [Pseudoalteromonas ulvae]OUL56383.1 PadR family transcriptional regulator [Pseudoalteromonas ulvae]
MTEKEKYLGEFEQMILLAVLRLDHQAYGTTIRQLLAQEINRDVTIGALYTTLDRLEKKGLVTSTLGEATNERGGRAKKYFQVSAEGQRALKRSKDALNNLWQGIALSQAGERYEPI